MGHYKEGSQMDAQELIWRHKSGERDFVEANLRGADLHEANLHGANLRGADLHGANLRWADLSGADLRWANLRWANLRGADLHEANLSEARYSPLLLLAEIEIGDVSDRLTTELMKWDAEMRVFGGPSFALWATGDGGCPFGGAEQRAFHFNQKRHCFTPSPRRMNFPQLFRAVMEELGVTI
jgi:hypothetical protein